MTIEKFRPDTLPPAHGYTQVLAATGTKTIYTSGQVGVDVDLNFAGGDKDYRAQAAQAANNVYAAVTAAGATPADIVKLTVYVVDPTEENQNKLYEGLGEAAVAAGAKSTAMTLIGTTMLADPRAIVEIDAIAVI